MSCRMGALSGLLSIFLIHFFCLNSNAQIVSLDTGFGANGVFKFSGNTGLNFGTRGGTVVPLGDGKMVFSGYATKRITPLPTSTYFVIARLTSNGSLDPGFGEDGMVLVNLGNSSVIEGSYYGKPPVIQPDGKIVATATIYNPQTLLTEMLVLRLNADGTFDNNFGSDGKVSIDFGDYSDFSNSVVLQPDGKILVGGGYLDNFSQSHFAIARLLPNGLPDQSFSNNGKKFIQVGTISEAVVNMVLQADGKIVFAGTTGFNTSFSYMVVVRLNGDGTDDQTYNNGSPSILVPFATSTSATDITIQDDQKIIVVGSSQVSSNLFFAAARLAPTGRLDYSFDSDGLVTQNFGNPVNHCNSVYVRNGKVILIGDTYVPGSDFEMAVMRLNYNGSLDKTFDLDGKKVFNVSEFFEVALGGIVLSDGKLVLSGTDAREFILLRTTPVSDSCSNLFVSGGEEIIKITGSASSRVDVEVISQSSLTVIEKQSFTGITNNIVLDSIAPGRYVVNVTQFDSNQEPVCESSKQVTVIQLSTLPTLDVADVMVDESRGTVNLQICASSPRDSIISVIVTIRDSTAKFGEDYLVSRDTIYIIPRQTCWSVDIPLVNDSIGEPDEYLIIELSHPQGAVLGDSIAVLKITDDDSSVVTCDSIKVIPNSRSISVQGLTAPRILLQVSNSAWANVFNQSYTNSPGTVTIPNLVPGKYYVSVIFMQSDWTGICNREFYDVTVTDSVAIRPSITLSDITVNENAGFAFVNICVSNAGQESITLGFSTVNGSAIGDLDFTSIQAGGSLSFNKDDSCRTIQIRITDDGLAEPAESFNFVLTSISGTVDLLKPAAVVTIIDNDQNGSPCANMTIEPGPGSVRVNNLVAPIALVQVSTSTWSVIYNQIHNNYNGDLTVPSLLPGSYYVRINLFDANWQPICEKEAYITVTAGNPEPTIIINDVNVNENSGVATIEICLSSPHSQTVTVNYETFPVNNGTSSAREIEDYISKSGSVTIPAGQTCASISLVIVNNNVQEPTEVFSVRLTNPVNALMPDNTGLVFIEDDDNCSPGTICARNTCPATTVDLNTVYSIPVLPPGVSISWHRDPIATVANQLLPGQVSSVSQSGTFYAAMQTSVNGSICFSSTIKVEVTIISCSVTPVTGSIGNLKASKSVDENNDSFKAVPNPFRDMVTVWIESDKEEKARLTMLDLTGRVVASKTVTLLKGNNSVKFEGFGNRSTGTYFINVLSNSINKTTKIVRQ